METFELISELGLPIAGALVMAYFIFLVMKQLMEGLVSEIQTVQGITKMLITRASIMNNDIIRIDTSVSSALGLTPDLSRIARAENFVEDGKIDARRDLMDIVAIISEFGFPTVMVVGLGYFVYFVWQTINKVIDPAVQEMKMTIIRLTDQLRLLDQDMIRLQQKVNTVLELKEHEKEKKRNT
jgi:hypothetical protein